MEDREQTSMPYEDRLRISHLSLSLILSFAIVLFIHFVFIYPDVQEKIARGEELIYKQVERDISRAVSRDTGISEVIEAYRASGTQLAVVRVTSQARQSDAQRARIIRVQGTAFQVTILESHVFTEVRLALFGSVLILFALTFFFIRIIFLYRENILIKRSLTSWEKKIGSISGKLNSVQPRMDEALAELQEQQPRSYEEWERQYQRMCEFEVLLDAFRGNTSLMTRYTKVKAHFDYKFTCYYLKHVPIWKDKADHSPRFLYKILPEIVRQKYGRPVFVLVFDSMRLDHWVKVKPLFKEMFPYHHIDDSCAWALLPSYTPYCRNSLLSGEPPIGFADMYHNRIQGNQHEEKLFHRFLKTHNLQGTYIHRAENEAVLDKVDRILAKPPDVTALIYHFIDGLTHTLSVTRTDESLFREHVLVEFHNTVLQRTLKKIRESGGIILLTSDHGNVLARETIRINQFDIEGTDQKSGTRHAPRRFVSGQAHIRSANEFKTRNTHLILDPLTFMLPNRPSPHYAICRGPYTLDTEDGRKTFEYVHGGASLTELLVPHVIIKPEHV